MVQKLICPFIGVIVGLTDTTEIAGNGFRPAKMNVAAVGPPGVQGLHVGGSQNTHAKSGGQDVAVVLPLFGHVSDPDVARQHQLPVFDGLPGLADEPREILQGADLEGHGIFHINVGPLAIQIVSHSYESTGITLSGKPLKIGHVGRAHLFQASHQIFRVSGLHRFPVDGFRSTVAIYNLKQTVDRFVFRVCEHFVDFIQAVFIDKQQVS